MCVCVTRQRAGDGREVAFEGLCIRYEHSTGCGQVSQQAIASSEVTEVVIA